MYPVAQKDWLRARTYFNDINPYIMDAKKMGNLGRYFNHSCNPNVFVQNVFIDTHDPRFPEVAFFAKRFVYIFLILPIYLITILFTVKLVICQSSFFFLILSSFTRK